MIRTTTKILGMCVIAILVGVGIAYAATWDDGGVPSNPSVLQGDAVISGALVVDTLVTTGASAHFRDGASPTTSDMHLIFGTLSGGDFEQIWWSQSTSRFRMSDDLRVDDALEVGTNLKVLGVSELRGDVRLRGNDGNYIQLESGTVSGPNSGFVGGGSSVGGAEGDAAVVAGGTDGADASVFVQATGDASLNAGGALATTATVAVQASGDVVITLGG